MFEKRDASDRKLLEQAAGGDEHALGELYSRHGTRCLRRARNVLRDAALAEDAVQEAFLDLWRTAPRFDARRGEVVTWLSVL
ncbi:MAG: sigma factor, partial [Gaiellaceae bacterium]